MLSISTKLNEKKRGIIMSGIIKTRKENRFTTLHNEPLQNLKNLKSIGLLSYLMSLPSDWTIYKTQLAKTFGRGPVNTAFEELLENRYLFIIKTRVGKSDNYLYYVSDTTFSDDYIREEIDNCKQPITEVIAHNFTYEAIENEDTEQDFSDVDFRQSKTDSPKRTVQNRQLQKKEKSKETSTKKIKKNETLKHCNSESVPAQSVNNEVDNDLTALINEYVAKGLTQTLIEDLFNTNQNNPSIKNQYAYLRSSCDTILENRKNKIIELITPTEKEKAVAQTPEWYQKGEHLKHDTRTEEEKLADAQKFEAQRLELLARMRG